VAAKSKVGESCPKKANKADHPTAKKKTRPTQTSTKGRVFNYRLMGPQKIQAALCSQNGNTGGPPKL